MSRRPLDVFGRARLPKPAPSMSSTTGEWMPLADAARALRRAQRDSDLDRISRGLSENDESLLAFWARRVAQIGVAVYGCRIMSTKLEIVPDAEVLSGRIVDQATRLDIGRGEPTQDFCALQVKRREFEACLARAGEDGNFQA